MHIQPFRDYAIYKYAEVTIDLIFDLRRGDNVDTDNLTILNLKPISQLSRVA